MKLSRNERLLVWILRHFTPQQQISLIDFIHRSVQTDSIVQSELRQIRRNQRYEGIEKPLPLVFGMGAAKSLNRFEFQGGEIIGGSRDGIGGGAESEQIVRSDSEDVS